MIEPQLSAEQRARAQIDRQLADAGWAVQGRAELNLFAGQGVAVREAIMRPGHGRADYLLYVDQRAARAPRTSSPVPGSTSPLAR
jgi:type I restriction enzyme R subunit